MITKEENALLQLIRSMNIPKPEQKRKKTRNDIRLEVHKDWVYAQSKKILC